MEKICFITNKYPNCVDPNGLVFVQQLVWTIADKGKKCTVICPLAINLNIDYRKVPYYLVETTENGNKIEIYFPKYFGFGQSRYIFGKSPAPITTNLFTSSVIRTIMKNKLVFDAVYGHFVTPAGIAAARVGRKLYIPSFLAYGESTSWSIDQFGVDKTRNELHSLSGVIAVSSRNRDLLINMQIIEKEKIKVFPNGYRPERFYPIEKNIARKKMGWDENQFIVGLVGSLDVRKGPLRLQEAVERVNDVFFVCAGKGNLVLTSDRCIMAEPVNNDELPYFYSALDVFVLPTLNEGCCNAIIEAMACGCPIITSDLSFNDDILDDNCSIRVNPENIDQISKAIELLYNNEQMLVEMNKAVLLRASGMTLNMRADNIIEYIENASKDYYKVN